MFNDTKLTKIIYDLNIMPITYDFGHFLVHADAIRQLTSKEALIDLTIRADNFRDFTLRDSRVDEHEKWWRGARYRMEDLEGR